MDKVKKIFSPGHQKDDDIMYGNPSSAQGNTASSEAESASEQKEHNVLRQVINPNTANYEEEAFGKPAPGATGQFDSEMDKTQLHTLPEVQKREHGVLRQIFNPHGDKYDEQAYGTTAVAEEDVPKDPDNLQTIPEAKKQEHGILRQILNPGGANYDEQAFGTTAVTEGDATGESTKPLTESVPTQESTVASTGSHATGTLPGAQPSTITSTTDAQPSESTTTAFGSHFGKDATLAGAGLAAGGIAASEVKQSPWSKPNMDSNTTAQDSALSSKQVTLPTSTGVESSDYEDCFKPSGTSVVGETPQLNTAPADVAQATYTARSYNLSGPDSGGAGEIGSTGVATGTVGGTVAGAGAGTSTADTTALTPGIAKETPHVPGEFPLESGEDPHGTHVGPATAAARAAAAEPGAAGFESAQPQQTVGATGSSNTTGTHHEYGRDVAVAGAATALGAGTYEATRSHGEGTTSSQAPATTNVTILGRNVEPSGTTAEQTPALSSQHTSAATTTPSAQPSSAAVAPQTSTTTASDHHYGRDAAVAGGAGAAGVAAYDLAKGHDTPATYQPTKPTTFTPEAAPSHEPATPATQQPVASGTGSTEKPTEHHYGRDAAIAGGAGAAGAGIYAAAKDHGDTGPASKTIGPHESNVANVVDPRVKPDPSAALEETNTKAQEKALAKEQKEQEKAHAKEVKEQEKAHAKELKEQEKEAKAQEKEARKEAKAHEKEVRAQEKAHEKEVKAHEKELRAQEKAHEKEVKAQEKEARKEAKEQEKLAKREGREHEQDEDHAGRDAALAGGAGAAGVGAYEAAKHHDDTGSASKAIGPHDDTGPASKTIGPHESNVANIVDPRVQPNPEQLKSATSTEGHHNTKIADQIDPNTSLSSSQTQKDETHHGRDAAVAGGLGAAGVGAYEMSKDRGDTGPASKTIGPHESNVANIVDPRVQPDPEKMKDSTTSGPHRSDFANKADPRVESDPAKAQQSDQSGSGHGLRTTEAETAGAAGVAGVAGAGAGEFESSGLDRRDTGPASKTIGPHKSNILNVLDPRVKPVPELMKEKEPLTTGPHRSDIANIIDPRVKSNPGQAQQQSSSEQHSGRDAALGAGAGVGAGALAYEAEKKHSQHTEDESKLHESQEEKHKHNKLQKPRPDEPSEKSEKSEKQGFFSKILHGRKSSEDRRSSEGRDPSERRTSASAAPAAAAAGGAGAAAAASSHGNTTTGEGEDIRTEPHTGLPINVGKYGTGAGGTDGAPQIAGYHQDPVSNPTGTQFGQDEIRIEPHTGLPMNVGKYGPGVGGTDGAPQISGYHETDPAIRDATIGTATGADKGQGAHPGEEGVAGPDWDEIKKKNTIY